MLETQRITDESIILDQPAELKTPVYNQKTSIEIKLAVLATPEPLVAILQVPGPAAPGVQTKVKRLEPAPQLTSTHPRPELKLRAKN